MKHVPSQYSVAVHFNQWHFDKVAPLLEERLKIHTLFSFWAPTKSIICSHDLGSFKRMKSPMRLLQNWPRKIGMNESNIWENSTLKKIRFYIIIITYFLSSLPPPQPCFIPLLTALFHGLFLIVGVIVCVCLCVYFS